MKVYEIGTSQLLPYSPKWIFIATNLSLKPIFPIPAVLTRFSSLTRRLLPGPVLRSVKNTSDAMVPLVDGWMMVPSAGNLTVRQVSVEAVHKFSFSL